MTSVMASVVASAVPRAVVAALITAGFAAGVAAQVASTPRWGGADGSAPVVDTVRFVSADGHTPLVGYLFRPPGDGPFPAVVMLHGRAGPYSTAISPRCTWVDGQSPSPCNAGSQSARSVQWGRFWAARGVLALHVDSFGPRGLAHGFGRHTHGAPEREVVSEITVRPLDAMGALAWLRTRPDVRHRLVGLQGWSNGASTVLNTVAPGSPVTGWRFALALYPGCGAKAVAMRPYGSQVPLTVFLGSEDEEVSPTTCEDLLGGAPAPGGGVQTRVYEGATHDFDDPGAARQSFAANQAARADVLHRVEQIARRAFAPPAGRAEAPDRP